MFGIGTPEMIVIGIVAVLLFGSRLPSVARSLGKSMTEFKKGMHDFQDEINSSSRTASRVTDYGSSHDRAEATAPKFEPPTSEPAPETAAGESPVQA